MIKLISGSSNLPLASKISEILDIPLLKNNIKKHSDGEIGIELKESVAGCDIVVVQSLCSPANDYIIELLIIIDALKRGFAKSVSLVIPYFGYSRQDKLKGGSISAKVIAQCLESVGVDKIITIDLHTPQIVGFFNVPVHNICISEVFDLELEDNTVTVSPDIGGVVRSRMIADKYKLPLCVVEKRRDALGGLEVMHIIGNVDKMNCIFIDDIVDSANTVCKAATAIMQKGAISAKAYITHGVLSKGAEVIKNSDLSQLHVSNSILKNQNCDNIAVTDVSDILAKKILQYLP